MESKSAAQLTEESKMAGITPLYFPSPEEYTAEAVSNRWSS